MRDEEAIRRSRAQSWDESAELWLTPAPPEEMAEARAHYIEHGWRPDPDNPKIPWAPGVGRSMKPDGN
jgi:hypothetical protein